MGDPFDQPRKKEKINNMPRSNEATDTDLKIIERLTQHLGWKRGDTLLYQQEFALSIVYRIMVAVPVSTNSLENITKLLD